MNWTTFKKYNNIVGWATFAVALLVYTLTLESTSSFWDCGEYIATSVKLQVGHPPGAPLFQIMGAFINTLTHSTPDMQAWMMNFLSGLSSAFAVLFTVWITTALLRRFIYKNNEDKLTNWMILAAGALAGLTFTFTDTFWFNAVEAEVYAMATALAALLFWLVFKWEADESPKADRWIMLIFLVIGLSIGVHMLAFIVIPSIAVIYFFKRYDSPESFKEFRQKKHLKPFFIALFVGLGILIFIYKWSLPLVFWIFNNFELFFVNTLGMPFHSGTIFSVVFILGLILFGIHYTTKKVRSGSPTRLNFVSYYSVHAFMFLVIGYLCWLMLPIRANSFTPINENKPGDAVSLTSYYNRDQYGQSALLYGPSYTAYNSSEALNPQLPYLDGNPIYAPDYESGKYVIVDARKGSIPNYKKEYLSLFPRMAHRGVARNYKARFPLHGKKTPSLMDNLNFFFRYQLTYMYGRYFAWNFIGRQSDTQGRADAFDGNWITGINFIDQDILGVAPALPETLADTKTRNVYYGLPFLLGIIGLVFHFKRDYKRFIALGLLHFFGGIGLVINNNMKLFEPRERDYVYTIAFMTFAIWIGMSLPHIVNFLREKVFKKSFKPAFGLAFAFILLVSPVLLAVQNWDDHDRRGRYTALKLAKSYLEPCLPNSILFNMGDNDTFPLWYAQEIEGVRPDMKLVNLSLFNTDWYIEAQQKASYTAEPIPSQIGKEKYRAGNRDIIHFYDRGFNQDSAWTIQQLVSWIGSDHPKTKVKTQSGSEVVYFPVKKIRIPVNKENVLKYNIVAPEDADKILPYIEFTINKSYLEKKDMMILDILANFDWKRPIYFAMSIGGNPATYMFLHEHLQLEGMVYQLVPIRTGQKSAGSMGRVNADRMYKNITTKFSWVNFNNKDIYQDETCRQNEYQYRAVSVRTAEKLILEGKLKETREILDLVLENTRLGTDNMSYYDLSLLELLHQSKHPKSKEVFQKMGDYLYDWVDYLTAIPTNLNGRDSKLKREGMLAQAYIQMGTKMYPELTKLYRKELSSILK